MKHTLELNIDQLLMVRDVIEGDIIISSGREVDFSDAALLQYYADRAAVKDQVNELLGFVKGYGRTIP